MFSSSSCIFVSCGISIQENHYVTKTFMWWICISVELLKTDESLYHDQFLSNPVMHMCDTSLKWDTNVSIHSLCVHRLLKRVKLQLSAGNFDLITIWHGMMIETFSCMMLWKLTKKEKEKILSINSQQAFRIFIDRIDLISIKNWIKMMIR